VNVDSPVLQDGFKPSEDIDIQTVDSEELRPNLDEMDASNAENPEPVNRSLIEPESGDNFEIF